MSARRRELLLLGAGVAATASVLALLLPAHGDMAAHLYRTLLVRRGDYLWDNLWYGGDYSIASYSLLYYFLAAWVGNATVVIAATVAQALLFATVVQRAWSVHARATTYVFALLAVEPLVRSEYPFALGLALALGVVASLQRRHLALAALCALLSLASSPLAFVFLCLALLGIFVTRPSVDRRSVIFGSLLAALALIYTALAHWTGLPWVGYPFRATSLFPILLVGGLGLLLTFRLDGAQPIAGIFGVWALAALAGFFVPTPIGLNFGRPLFMFAPLLLVPVFLRPAERNAALLSVSVVLSIVAVQLGATIVNVFRHTADQRALWATAVGFLRDHQTPNYRVEVVPTSAHWEAYYLPRAGFAISRGWYRQLDLAENGLLYDSSIAPASYRRWLQDRSVRFVILAQTLGLDGSGAAAEAALLRSGRSGLVLVRRTADLEIFALRHPLPLLRPATLGTVTEITSQRIAGAVRQPGTYQLDVTYMPYWEASPGITVKPAPDRTTTLEIRRAGRFVLTASSERILGLG
jgi:hypothetical protein